MTSTTRIPASIVDRRIQPALRSFLASRAAAREDARKADAARKAEKARLAQEAADLAEFERLHPGLRAQAEAKVRTEVDAANKAADALRKACADADAAAVALADALRRRQGALELAVGASGPSVYISYQGRRSVAARAMWAAGLGGMVDLPHVDAGHRTSFSDMATNIIASLTDHAANLLRTETQ